MAERWEAPRYGGCAYASSNPAEAPPKMVVKVITETVTETIRDGQAFVHKTTTTASLTPQELQARGIVDDARELQACGIVREARWEERDGVERCAVRSPQRTRAPRDEESTEPQQKDPRTIESWPEITPSDDGDVWPSSEDRICE